MGVGDVDPAHLEELAWLLRDARERTVGRESEWEKERRRIADNADPATVAALEALWAENGSQAESRSGAGDAVLFDVLDFFLAYVAFPSQEAAWAATLWAAHTHFAGHLETTPRLAVVSPEPQCGKTRLLEVFELLCSRPFNAVNTSVAAMFRLVESVHPTLLFDEADTYFGTKAREHEELRGLINAGHRRGAQAFRCVGDPKKMEVRAFPAFCPVALACIGDLPATIFDRAVIVRMRRRRRDERVMPFRQRTAGPHGHQHRRAPGRLGRRRRRPGRHRRARAARLAHRPARRRVR